MAVKYNRAKMSVMSPYTLMHSYTEKELRNAYAKFRREFRQREKEFKASEYADSEVIQEAHASFSPTLASEDITAVVHKIPEITRWLESKTSTVEGMLDADAQRIKTMQLKGYDFIQTRDDLKTFGKFMAEVRPYFSAQSKYSERATAELYQFALDNNISLANIKRHYGWYYRHLDDILEADLTTRTGHVPKKPLTAKQLADKLGLEYRSGRHDSMYQRGRSRKPRHSRS